MEAHGADLRSQGKDEGFVETLKRNFREAAISKADRALGEFAVKLTRTPWKMVREDLDRLREHGFSDEAILDAVQVIAYFNYINRIAEALGVDPEPGTPGSGRDGTGLH